MNDSHPEDSIFDEGTPRERARRGLQLLRDNPLGLILVGLAVGIIAGVLAPVTRLEQDTIAPLADDVVDRAKRAADDVVEHSRGVFAETLSAASASAAKHGQALAEEIQNEFRNVPSGP